MYVFSANLKNTPGSLCSRCLILKRLSRLPRIRRPKIKVSLTINNSEYFLFDSTVLYILNYWLLTLYNHSKRLSLRLRPWYNFQSVWSSNLSSISFEIFILEKTNLFFVKFLYVRNQLPN
jgi:hypothetical protein